MFNKKFLKAICILIGTVIGAGIFGLPYVVAKIGFPLGVIYFIILAIAVIITTLCYGEVILRTKNNYQMSGYAHKYLGLTGKRLVTLSLILGIYSALLVYIIGVGNFLFAILAPYFGGTAFIYSLIFWFLGSLILFFGLKTLAIGEAAVTILMVGLALVISFLSIKHWQLINLSYIKIDNFNYLFSAMGVIFFALGGATAVPAMRETLKNKPKLLKKAIIIGMLVPVFIYLLFIFSIVATNGQNTTEQAIGGLAPILGPKVVLLGAIFGIFAMFTSFLPLGYVLKELYEKDYKFSRTMSLLLTCLIPLVIFLLGARSFVQVLGISGSILGGFEGMLLVIMYYRAKKLGDREPEYKFKLPKPVAYGLYFIFTITLLYQIYFLIN